VPPREASHEVIVAHFGMPQLVEAPIDLQNRALRSGGTTSTKTDVAHTL